MTEKTKIVLYVDDDIDDRELLGEAMQKVAPEIKLTYAENGLKALELLKQIKEPASLPCLIVLDINMPYLDGRQTFVRIKSDPLLKTIPLIILSTGESPADKALFGKEGIPYFIKPSGFLAIEDIASQIEQFCRG